MACMANDWPLGATFVRSSRRSTLRSRRAAERRTEGARSRGCPAAVRATSDDLCSGITWPLEGRSRGAHRCFLCVKVGSGIDNT